MRCWSFEHVHDAWYGLGCTQYTHNMSMVTPSGCQMCDLRSSAAFHPPVILAVDVFLGSARQ